MEHFNVYHNNTIIGRTRGNTTTAAQKDNNLFLSNYPDSDTTYRTAFLRDQGVLVVRYNR